MAMTTQPPAPDAKKDDPPAQPALPLSQSNSRRRNWPAWAKQLPYFLRLPPARQDFSLVDRVELKRILEGTDPQIIADIEKDLDVLERDLMHFFVKRDTEASAQQNRYRLYQIAYIFLAMLATIIGSLIVLALNQNPPRWVPVLGFLETLVALLATFLSNIGTRGEPSFLAWLDNRRRAESLRREFFRYLVVLPPYDTTEGYKRRMLLAERAALINQGKFPDEKSTNGGSQS
jgi:hypothetical protein